MPGKILKKKCSKNGFNSKLDNKHNLLIDFDASCKQINTY